MLLNSLERSFLGSHSAPFVGLINVTNHLLTPRGQAFALSPITLSSTLAPCGLPLSCSSNSFTLSTLLVHRQIRGSTTMRSPCLQSSVRLLPVPVLSALKYQPWPLKHIYVVNVIRSREPEQICLPLRVPSFSPDLCTCYIRAGF